LITMARLGLGSDDRSSKGRRVGIWQSDNGKHKHNQRTPAIRAHILPILLFPV
jgi:hypothetical protein